MKIINIVLNFLLLLKRNSVISKYQIAL